MRLAPKVLVVWTAVSVPVALLVARVLRDRQAEQVLAVQPGLSAPKDRLGPTEYPANEARRARREMWE